MYCAWRIPAYLRCTQCSILLHLMDICFLTCICLWQISQIQTFLFKVVGPGLVSTSPAFVSSSASHSAGPHCWGRGGSTQFAQQLESAVTAPPLVGCVVCFLTCPSVFLLPTIAINKYNVVLCNYIRLFTKRCRIREQHVLFYIDIVVVIMKTKITV